MFHGPGGQAPRLHLYAGWRTFWRERSHTEGMWYEDTGLLWMYSIKFKCIIPGAFRVNFPIGMREFASDLPPVFIDFEGMYQWPTFNSETVVVACLCPDRHRQMEPNILPSAQFPFHAIKRPCSRLLTLSLLKLDRCSFGPSWNAQQEGEMDRTVSRDTQVDVFLKWIGGQHFDARSCTSNIRGHHAWSIDQRNKAIIGGTHPEVTGTFGPALVHIGGTTAIVWCQAKDVGIRAIGGIDTIFGNSAEHLIGLLIILMRPHIWLKRGRQGIKGDAFQPISKGDLTEDRE